MRLQTWQSIHNAIDLRLREIHQLRDKEFGFGKNTPNSGQCIFACTDPLALQYQALYRLNLHVSAHMWYKAEAERRPRTNAEHPFCCTHRQTALLSNEPVPLMKSGRHHTCDPNAWIYGPCKEMDI